MLSVCSCCVRTRSWFAEVDAAEAGLAPDAVEVRR
jgi:hypothetical protein